MFPNNRFQAAGVRGYGLRFRIGDLASDAGAAKLASNLILPMDDTGRKVDVSQNTMGQGRRNRVIGTTEYGNRLGHGSGCLLYSVRRASARCHQCGYVIPKPAISVALLARLGVSVESLGGCQRITRPFDYGALVAVETVHALGLGSLGAHVGVARAAENGVFIFSPAGSQLIFGGGKVRAAGFELAGSVQ
jgi:hypothetical protein